MGIVIFMDKKAVSIKWKLLEARLVTEEEKELAIKCLDAHFKKKKLIFLDLTDGTSTEERWKSMHTREFYSMWRDAMDMLLVNVKNNKWGSNQHGDSKGGAIRLEGFMLMENAFHKVFPADVLNKKTDIDIISTINRDAKPEKKKKKKEKLLKKKTLHHETEEIEISLQDFFGGNDFDDEVEDETPRKKMRISETVLPNNEDPETSEGVAMEVEASEDEAAYVPPEFPTKILVNENGSLLDDVKYFYKPIFERMSHAIIKVSANDPEVLNYMIDELKEVINTVKKSLPEKFSSQIDEILQADMPAEIPVVTSNQNNELRMDREFISIKSKNGVPDVTITSLFQPGLVLRKVERNAVRNVESIGE